MDQNVPRCTVPVEIAGKICEFGLRPDRYYSRVPVDIWRLFKTALQPLPPAESMLDNDLTGCLGMCTGEFSVLNRNLSDQPLLVSREQSPTIGLSALRNARLVYNFAECTVRLSDDYAKRENPKPMSRSLNPSEDFGRPIDTRENPYHPSDDFRRPIDTREKPYNPNDDFRRPIDPRDKRQFDSEEYEQRGRFYEREDEYWDDRNMKNSLERRTNEREDGPMHIRRNDIPDFGDRRRPNSPANYRSDFPDDMLSDLRRDLADRDGPGSRSEFDRRAFIHEQLQPEFNDSFRSDNRFDQEINERLNREKGPMGFDPFERNFLQHQNALRQQSNLNDLSGFDSMARGDMFDSLQMKQQLEQDFLNCSSIADSLWGTEQGANNPKKKKKGSLRCTFCLKFGHVRENCHTANAIAEPPKKKGPKKPRPHCDSCKKFGHSTVECRFGRGNVKLAQSRLNKPSNAAQPVKAWDTWMLDNAGPSIQQLNERAAGNFLHMLRGGN